MAPDDESRVRVVAVDREDRTPLFISWSLPNLLWVLPAYAAGVAVSAMIPAVDPSYEGAPLSDIVTGLTLGIGLAFIYVLPAFTLQLALWGSRNRIRRSWRRATAVVAAPIVMAPVLWLCTRLQVGSAPGEAPDDPAGSWTAVAFYVLVPVFFGLLVRLPPVAVRRSRLVATSPSDDER